MSWKCKRNVESGCLSFEEYKYKGYNKVTIIRKIKYFQNEVSSLTHIVFIFELPHVKLRNFLNITHSQSQSQVSEMSSPTDFDRSMLVEYSAAFMYYIEKHKLMEVMSRLLAEISVADGVTDVRRWMGENITRIGVEIYTKSMDAFHRGVRGDFYQLPRSFYHRIVLHGKPGSGRRSLAYVLAQRWNLLILDADVLAYHSINKQDQDEPSRLLQEAIEKDCVYKRSQAVGNLIENRLLQEDALHRGWILINYPNNKCEAEELFEGFTVPPNRFVFLQIDERLARMRILLNSYSPGPQAHVSFVDRQMAQFRKSEPALNSYLSQRREVVYVDASPCFEQVKCGIISDLTKTPYVLGKKYGEANAKI